MAKRSKAKTKAKSTKKTSEWSSLSWQKIQVTKDGDEMLQNPSRQGSDSASSEAGTFDESKYLSEKNHYDDPKANPKDLYDDSYGSSAGIEKVVDGANDPGIFFGLEVIDGSQYSVEKVPVYNKHGGNGDKPDGYMTKLVLKDDDHSNHFEEAKQSMSKKDNVESVSSASKSEGGSNGESTITKEPNDSEIDMSKLSRKEKNKLKLAKLKARRKEIKLEKKRKREQRQAQAKAGSSSSTEDATKVSNDASESAKPKKKKRRNKSSDQSELSSSSEDVIITEQCVDSIQNSWCLATGGVYLHKKLCASLYRSGFHSPTPIQGSTLAASILGLRDIVGAAPTGSGKTLSYLLPIMHTLMVEEDERNETNDNAMADDDSQVQNSKVYSHPLTALILCPTRELAMQVSSEFAKLTSDAGSESSIKCGTIVGGLSEQKQRRVLDVNRPPVLVATPGRLWDLMSSGNHDHLNNLKSLRYLVVDEADRMASQGNFPQLESILDKIQEANPSLEYMRDHEEIDDSDDEDDEDRMLGLPGIRGEAKVQMLNDELLQMIARQEKKFHGDGDSVSSDAEGEAPEPVEMDDEEYENERKKMEELEENELDIEGDEDEEEEKPVKRQTFIFSATLTLPASTHRNIGTDQKAGKKKGKQKQLKSVNGFIAELLEIVGAQGQAKVVDLSTSSKTDSASLRNSDPKQKTKATKQENNQGSKVNLPPGLSLFEIRCTQKHKDSHLYAFLSTTKQGASGPCLVFCNSIGAVKRVGETLKVLGLPARMLHAQMQQKARLASLESLNGTNSRSIVVCTDVAARGLDLPRVASVVHYDVARAIDTYVHRAGRTARGMGENAKGWSVSLVSSSEEKKHESICQAVKGPGKRCFDMARMDSRLLINAQERVNLASKIVSCEDVESKTSKSNKWFIDAAEEAGLDLDEDLLDEGLLGGSLKERQRFHEAKRARQALKALLAKPMRTQAFGKFLSNAGLAEAIRAENEVKPFIVRVSQSRAKKSKRKASK